VTECEWDDVLDVNLKGSCFCAQSVARAMVSAGRQGAIINIASGAALRGSPRGVHYVASKGGILSLTRAMALELAPLSHQGQCDRAGAHGYSPAALR
jgi:NAD(P)-dependent dehydrogenase (short-subunit alcohol dehydrogenase family)